MRTESDTVALDGNPRAPACCRDPAPRLPRGHGRWQSARGRYPQGGCDPGRPRHGWTALRPGGACGAPVAGRGRRLGARAPSAGRCRCSAVPSGRTSSASTDSRSRSFRRTTTSTSGDSRRSAPQETLADLATAAELARGPFMAGFTLRDSPEFDDWRAARAASVERTVGRVLDRLIAALEANGDLAGGDRGCRQADRPRPARRVGACPADGAPRRGRRSGRRGAPVPRVRRGPGARARGRPACRDDCPVRSHPRRAGAGGFASSSG